MWTLETLSTAGGMGEIYRARTPSKRPVALKRLRSFQPGAVSLFENEVMLLTRLRHPHIVSILGCSAISEAIFGEDRGPCYWMELVEGDNILDAARSVSPDRIIGWLVQSLEALRYLHAQGVLHGDISPKNLLVDSSGNVKLIDFGLAAALGESASVDAATLPYLAPERMSGLHTPASDLFALGTVFYEALSGRHPRSAARGLHEMMSQKAPSLLQEAPSLAGAHVVAARAIDGMIEADPERRFSEAADVLEALKGRAVSEAPRKTAPYHSLTFWGAEEPLDRARQALEGVRQKTALFALHGTTGVGKRRFLSELTFRCALSGLGVQERFDGRFDVRPGAATYFRSLENLTVPELSKLLSLRRTGFPENGALIIFEWNDDLVTDEARTFLSRLARWPEVTEIPLSNLDRKDAAGLLRGALGPEVSEELVDRLYHRTGGNPGLLIGLVSRLRAGETEEDLDTLVSQRELLLWKVLSLADPEKKALAAAVAAGRPVTHEALAEFVAEPELSPALHRLLESHCLLLDRETASYRVAIPLFADVLQEILPPDEIAAIHQRWLGLLKKNPYPDLQRLHHAIALKDEAEVIAGARPAADLLWSQERKEESLRLIDRCLPVVKEDGESRVEHARLLKEKMNLLSDLGRYEESLEVAERWFSLGPDNDAMPLKTVKYWFFTGMNRQNLANSEDAAQRLRRCLASGDLSDAAQRPFLARAHSLLGLLELRRGDTPAAKDQLHRALELADAKGRRRAEMLRHLSEVHAAASDRTAAFQALRDARTLYEEDGFEQGVFACLIQEGNLALADDDLAGAESAYARAEEIAQKLDNDALLANVWHNRSVLERIQGRLGEALKLLPKALEIFEMLGLKNEVAECRKNLALTEAAVSEAENLPDAFKARPKKRTDDRPSIEKRNKEPLMTTPTAFDWESAVSRLADLDRELLKETDMDIVLRRLMDSAMELARAQHGFLLLKTDTPDESSPIPGFTVAVARNVNRESLKSADHVLSLSVVHRAMESNEPVATDNALQDPRFRDAPSVHLGQFKSILALPIQSPQGILGVFYLDHPLKDGLFQGDLLRAMKLFAGLAALALQKGRMIEELKSKNDNLASQVDEQSSQMECLAQEVKESRIKLKNEYSDIVGRSPKMVEVLTLVDKVTDAKIPVWIFGESGTGKEAIARALHFNSARKNHPFVTENCSALPESLLESELFGHKKGAFTHATQDKKGLLHYADKGTIFLDEIADMSLNLQAKLLRFLQEGEIRPLGAHQVIKVDVRVISASNKDLRKLVAEGKFREDLFFRLNGITVKLPPLRDRLADLPLLAEHFLKGRASLHPEALRLLMAYTWPGNVRELQQTLETATLFTEDAGAERVVTRKALEFKDALFAGSVPASAAFGDAPGPASDEASKSMTPDLEKILRAIRDQCYHKAKAAQVLGISRRHLYTKLEQYGVSPESASLKTYIEKNLRG